MVWYMQDGRRVYLTHDHHNEGVYMVENVGGVDEPYTGDVADLCVAPPQREKTTDPVKLAWIKQAEMVEKIESIFLQDYASKLAKVREAVEKLAGKDCAGDRLYGGGEDNKTPIDIFDYNVDDAYDGGVHSGEVQLAREILAILDA